MKKIIRQNFSVLAADRIRDQILSLKIKPGSRLIIDNLADTLGISRTPVREGLRYLADEGLINYDGRSYVVNSFTKKEIIDLFSIRRQLERLSVRQAAERISITTLEKLSLLLDELEKHIDTKDVNSFILCDIKFHSLICEGSNNEQLKGILKKLNQQIWWISRIAFSEYPKNYTKSTTIDSHRNIVTALQNHDADSAEELMKKHLEEGERRKLIHLFPDEENNRS